MNDERFRELKKGLFSVVHEHVNNAIISLFRDHEDRLDKLENPPVSIVSQWTADRGIPEGVTTSTDDKIFTQADLDLAGDDRVKASGWRILQAAKGKAFLAYGRETINISTLEEIINEAEK